MARKYIVYACPENKGKYHATAYQLSLLLSKHMSPQAEKNCRSVKEIVAMLEYYCGFEIQKPAGFYNWEV